MKFIEDGSTRDGRVLIRSSASAKRGEYNKNEWKKEKEREREKKGERFELSAVYSRRCSLYKVLDGSRKWWCEIRKKWVLLLARLSSGSAALRGTKELRAKGRRRRTTEKRINHGWKDKKGARERERESLGLIFFLFFSLPSLLSISFFDRLFFLPPCVCVCCTRSSCADSVYFSIALLSSPNRTKGVKCSLILPDYLTTRLDIGAVNDYICIYPD